MLDASGAERDEDGSIIALRSVSRDGPSRAYPGGRSVPAEIAERIHHRAVDAARAKRPVAAHATPRATRWRWTGSQKLTPGWSAIANCGTHGTGAPRLRRPEQPGPRIGAGGRSAQVRAARDRHHRSRTGEDDALIAEIRRLSELDALREAASGPRRPVRAGRRRRRRPGRTARVGGGQFGAGQDGLGVDGRRDAARVSHSARGSAHGRRRRRA